MNEISEVMPLQFIVIFKNIKEHIQERNPMNVTNVEKLLHVSEVQIHEKIYCTDTYQVCPVSVVIFYFMVVFLQE